MTMPTRTQRLIKNGADRTFAQPAPRTGVPQPGTSGLRAPNASARKPRTYFRNATFRCHAARPMRLFAKVLSPYQPAFSGATENAAIAYTRFLWQVQSHRAQPWCCSASGTTNHQAPPATKHRQPPSATSDIIDREQCLAWNHDRPHDPQGKQHRQIHRFLHRSPRSAGLCAQGTPRAHHRIRRG